MWVCIGACKGQIFWIPWYVVTGSNEPPDMDEYLELNSGPLKYPEEILIIELSL